MAPDRRMARVIAPSAIALVSVAGFVVGLLALFGEDPEARLAADARGLASPIPMASPEEPTPTPALPSRPTRPLRPAPQPATPAPTPRATPAPAPAALPVVVLNNSRRQGLAASAASDLRGSGWAVRTVGNWRGRLADTTIYFPAGHQAQARRLARTLPGAERVRRSGGGLPSDAIVVVVTRHYPGG